MRQPPESRHERRANHRLEEEAELCQRVASEHEARSDVEVDEHLGRAVFHGDAVRQLDLEPGVARTRELDARRAARAQHGPVGARRSTDPCR